MLTPGLSELMAQLKATRDRTPQQDSLLLELKDLNTSGFGRAATGDDPFSMRETAPAGPRCRCCGQVIKA